ncbi:MAG: type VII secretion protein EccB [Propionibacteriaceae bacterium]|nr:type VII secretion protein EccB [Propionibacteriaceae bacterium]
MATRKDLLKAQSFLSRRMTAAFVDRDPDDPTPPLRRVGTASFVSVLLGVILLAGTALIGMLRPGTGGDAWKEEGIIISDTTAGMLFVYSDAGLVPMNDVASARLMAGGPKAAGPPRVVKVTTEALKGAKQLPTLGIAGAPGQLPAAGDMQADPIRMCSSSPNSAGDRFISLEFNASPVEDQRASFVVKTSDGKQYLVTNGKYHLLWSPQTGQTPLAGGLPTVELPKLWLSALPVGAPILPLTIDGVGRQPKKNPLNMRVGQLAVVEGSEGADNRYYVHLDEGLSQVSYLDRIMIQTIENVPDPSIITENDLALALNAKFPISFNTDIDPAKPKGPEGYGSLDEVSVCATFTTGENRTVVMSVDKDTPEMPPEHVKPYGNTVDYVGMDPLSGALLQNSKNPGEEAATFLVLNGETFPIPDIASRRALGYGDVKPALVPGPLIDLMPSGLEPDLNLSFEKIGPV